MAFPLPFLKPITRAAQTTSQHARAGSVPDTYTVCQQRALTFGTPEHSHTLRISAPSQSKSPRKLKHRPRPSPSPDPKSAEVSTQTYPHPSPRKRESDLPE